MIFTRCLRRPTGRRPKLQTLVLSPGRIPFCPSGFCQALELFSEALDPHGPEPFREFFCVLVAVLCGFMGRVVTEGPRPASSGVALIAYYYLHRIYALMGHRYGQSDVQKIRLGVLRLNFNNSSRERHSRQSGCLASILTQSPQCVCDLIAHCWVQVLGSLPYIRILPKKEDWKNVSNEADGFLQAFRRRCDHTTSKC